LEKTKLSYQNKERDIEGNKPSRFLSKGVLPSAVVMLDAATPVNLSFDSEIPSVIAGSEAP